jgi:hypothetical protein
MAHAAGDEDFDPATPLIVGVSMISPEANVQQPGLALGFLRTGPHHHRPPDEPHRLPATSGDAGRIPPQPSPARPPRLRDRSVTGSLSHEPAGNEDPKGVGLALAEVLSEIPDDVFAHTVFGSGPLQSGWRF